MFDRKGKIFIAGNKGMVGSALVRKFRSEGFINILTADRSELDLKDEVEV